MENSGTIFTLVFLLAVLFIREMFNYWRSNYLRAVSPQWHFWFAWHPVRVSDITEEGKFKFTFVWLATVRRRRIDNPESIYHEFKLQYWEVVK